ncbi:MAG TPA: dephospho-CoA kinase [Magnetospirillaceae bacterium]|nr:dephospho-CoA kinase [Magnetospirillaceae bacterium]
MMIGLTGGYCAGKNFAARLLEARGWHCVDVDILGHSALERCLPAVEGLLGPGIRKPDGSPDRKAIGALVFADPDLLARYEAVVHPVLFALVDEAVGGAEARDVCLNAAILYRLPQVPRCRAVLEVRAPLPLRILRGLRRDRLSICAVLERIRTQAPLWKRREDYTGPILILCNRDSEIALDRRLAAVLERLRDNPRWG